MKTARTYPSVTVTPKAEASLHRGHPWVYGEEITDQSGPMENGALVDVLSRKGSYLGTGFLSQHSKIRVRLLSRNANDRFDDAFWQRQAPLGLGVPQDRACGRRTWTAAASSSARQTASRA